MKKILISILILMFIINSTALANTETSLKVLVNNKLVDFPDAKPLIQDSRTLIPLTLPQLKQWDSLVIKEKSISSISV